MKEREVSGENKRGDDRMRVIGKKGGKERNRGRSKKEREIRRLREKKRIKEEKRQR